MVGPRSKILTWSQDSSWPLFHLFCACMLLLSVTSSAAGSLGCADGSREGLLGFDRIAACAGEWKGHVHNATTLCSPGWHVCSWYDHALLRNITWKIAMSVPGCYAFNAAQDGGRCQECREDLEHDDVAGIGQGCAHKNRGQSSCISGGRIDASCCVDSHFDRACAFQPRLMTGALCCRMPVKPPLIVVKPPERMHVYTGLIFLLTCQATGMPPPRIQWYKNGQQTTDNSRTSILSSGDLLVTLARKSDTGLYTCEVINEEGIDMASSFVTVTEYTSGCADGSTEGLHLHRTVHACAGRWEGHVQLGKTLCRRGWRVCNPKDKEALQQLTWLDFFDLSGCYAYNAANRHGHCRKCKDGRMAGIGRDCKWMRHSQSSCLSRGSVEVQNPHNSSGCHYKEGVTSGVVCCKRIKNDENKQSRKTTCTPPCENGGTCVDHNRCHCAPGYKGARCQNAICEPGCGMKGNCVKPNTCQCQSGYTGIQCSQKVPKCGQPCVNGGRCLNGKCRCLLGYQGRFCQYMSQHIGLAMLNRTEK